MENLGMWFRSLLLFSLVLLCVCPSGPLLSQNSGRNTATISGGRNNIYFIECRGTIFKRETHSVSAEFKIFHNFIWYILIDYFYYPDMYGCDLAYNFFVSCHFEETKEILKYRLIIYLVYLPEKFPFDCNSNTRFFNQTDSTSGFLREIRINVFKCSSFKSRKNASTMLFGTRQIPYLALVAKRNASDTRCHGPGWCKNAYSTSNPHCCNPDICHATTSIDLSDPVCCYRLERKRVSSDFTTRYVITLQTYYLAVSLLVIFTLLSLILGILQWKAMGQARLRKKQLQDLREKRKPLKQLSFDK